MNLDSRLRELDDPVRVGVIGSGIFGSQLIHAIEGTPGMETSAVADIEPERAETALRGAATGEDEVEPATTTGDVNEVIDSGGRAVVEDGTAIVDAALDVIVDATGDPDVAARNGFRSLLAGTHFVNVSVEADAVCGTVLSALADGEGVTYSLAFGDQPAQIVELAEWAGGSGFELVAAGRATREPEYYGTPTDSISRHGNAVSFGDGLEPDPVVYNSFIDGTKLAVETVAAANALGLEVDVPGTHRPSVPLSEIPSRLRPEEEGGVLSRAGAIESVTPADSSFSVFVVTRSDSRQLSEYYAQRPNVVTSEDGRYQFFHRPHHFAAETTVSIARAALSNEHTGASQGHTAEVIAAAKRDLEPGDRIDGGGGATVYGVAEDAGRAAENAYVPFELLRGAEVVEPIRVDEYVTREQVELETGGFLHSLREMQDGM